MTGTRRPIASRDTKTAARIAGWLARAGVAPNTISIASMGLAGLAGAAFWASGGTQALWLIVAAAGCQGRLLCNLFDGMVAVEGGRPSVAGAFWNEAPDRASDILIFVGMGLGVGAPALGWAAAGAAILTAYVRELGRAEGAGPDFSGPMAKPHRMGVATGAACLAILAPSIAGTSTVTIALWVIVLGAFLTAIRRSIRLIAGLAS